MERKFKEYFSKEEGIPNVLFSILVLVIFGSIFGPSLYSQFTGQVGNVILASNVGYGATLIITTARPINHIKPNVNSPNTNVLNFTVNNDQNIVSSPSLILHFNADPTTVMGYSVSLEPDFSDTVINMPYIDTVTFILPDQPAKYIIYVRYYSTTGSPSETLSKEVIYNSINPFLRNLKIGDKGEDVRLLQEFLNKKGFILTLTGLGSPGYETLIFGSLSKKALIRFQEANKLDILVPYGLKKGTGIFGPLTRKFINNISQYGG